jgi:hypothetical protein
MSDQQQDSSAGGGGAGDDLSGLTGFFFYAFIVHPITAWILRPGRFEKKKSILYAVAFLAALAAIKTGKEEIMGLSLCLSRGAEKGGEGNRTFAADDPPLLLLRETNECAPPRVTARRLLVCP